MGVSESTLKIINRFDILFMVTAPQKNWNIQSCLTTECQTTQLSILTKMLSKLNKGYYVSVSVGLAPQLAKDSDQFKDLKFQK